MEQDHQNNNGSLSQVPSLGLSKVSHAPSQDIKGLAFVVLAMVFEGVAIGVCSSVVNFDQNELQADYFIGDLLLNIGLSILAVVGTAMKMIQEWGW